MSKKNKKTRVRYANKHFDDPQVVENILLADETKVKLFLVDLLRDSSVIKLAVFQRCIIMPAVKCGGGDALGLLCFFGTNCLP